MRAVTKWEYLSDSERESLQKIPFNNDCVGCGIYIATEADFAKHFIIKPPFHNLGSCPLTFLRNLG